METAGAARTPTVMAGPIWGTPSFMNQPSGVIPTATATGTEWTVIRAMLVRKCVAPLCSIDSAAATPTVMDGPTRPTRGLLIRSAAVTPSPPKHCSGRTAIKTALATFRWVPSVMTARRNPVHPNATFRGAPIRTATVGRTTTVSLQPPSPSWARTQLHPG